MKRVLWYAAVLAVVGVVAPASASERPNVLMICVDDLNDWVGCLGGHPQAKTPNIDALASRGVLFTNAHCNAPICTASRASVMTSLRPARTGIYGLGPAWVGYQGDAKQGVVPLPRMFADAGYHTVSAGKVWPGGSYGVTRVGPGGGPGKAPNEKLVPPTPAGNNPWVDWGLYDRPESEVQDHKVADFICAEMSDAPADQPLYVECGFFLPHVPCHATPKFWDMFPVEDLVVPQIDRGDRGDCSPFAWYLHWNLPEPRITWLEHHDQHTNLVRAYLACTAMMDAEVGRVIKTLEETGRADNTVICLWSDHGWHLGEKNITGKNSLWEPSTRVPLIVAAPGVTPGVCGQPAELLDVYPTLTDLAGLKTPGHVEGLSLRPQLEDTAAPHRPVITQSNPGNFGVRDERYRLIRYADGSEELYDVLDDPDEATNRIEDTSLASAAATLREAIPKNVAGLAAGSHSRILEKKDGRWIWEGKPIDPDNPPMSIEPHTPADLPR